MEAPKPIVIETPKDEKDIKDIKFTYELDSKINNDNFLVMIGNLKDNLVIKVLNKALIKENYLSFFTYKQLKDISKSMRYFDDIKDIISFLENKGNKNEIFLKKENEKIFIEFKVISPSGKEDLFSLEIKPNEISDKELINYLLTKIDDLEKQINFLNKEVSKINNLEKQISLLNKEIEILKNDKNKDFQLDSKITNINEIKFIIDYLKETEEFKNKEFKLNLLYRGTRDGDRTENVHKICDGLKNIIVFMKSEEGNSYGMYSAIGWKTRKEFEYPIDDNSFLFSLNKKKIFRAKKGKVTICWIGNNVGLYISSTMGFHDKFLNEKNNNIYSSISRFENCKTEDFNSGKTNFKFLEIEIFQIK